MEKATECRNQSNCIVFFYYVRVPHTLEIRGDKTLGQIRLGNATPCNMDRDAIRVHETMEYIVDIKKINL